jgi:cytidine deaminase
MIVDIDPFDPPRRRPRRHQPARRRHHPEAHHLAQGHRRAEIVEEIDDFEDVRPRLSRSPVRRAKPACSPPRPRPARAAICPHSKFAVGAAMLAGDGTVWTGANVENASYTLGLCAERVALFYALTHGARDFTAVASRHRRRHPDPLRRVPPDPPRVRRRRHRHHRHADGELLRTTVRALLPFGFDASSLAREG